uniref:VWFA domain-containing protein n=1 Tax=Salvator merianae TaxID=96440 RepID=A0A8D0C2C8_SALMN
FFFYFSLRRHVVLFFSSKCSTDMSNLSILIGCVDTEKADIYFLVDSSTSVHQDYGTMKTFLQEVIKLFTVGPENVRFGLMQYSNRTKVEFRLDQHERSGTLEKAINNLKQLFGNTDTGKAISAMEPLFKEAKKQRKNKVPCYLIVVTDGRAQDDVKVPAENLRNAGIIIYAIGVKDADKNQLLEIAGQESRMYSVQQFEALKEIKNMLVRDICVDKGKVTILGCLVQCEQSGLAEVVASLLCTRVQKRDIQKSAICENKKADVMFLVDSSAGMGLKDYAKTKEFMKALVSKTDIGPDTWRVGVLQFSDTLKEEFPLDKYSTKYDIIEAIDQMSFINKATLTGKALQFVSNYFKPEKGARSSVNRMLILVTDGGAQDEIRTPAKALREAGIIIYSVGVVNPDITQLQEISGKSDKVFLEQITDDYQSFGKSLSISACSLTAPHIPLISSDY